MDGIARRVSLALALAVTAWLGMVPTVAGAPTIVRTTAHYEAHYLALDTCGIGPSVLSVDVLTVSNNDDPSLNQTLIKGTLTETSTGNVYRIVDHNTSLMLFNHSGRLEVFNSTLTVAGSAGGVVSRFLVVIVVMPGGVNTPVLEFVECRPA